MAIDPKDLNELQRALNDAAGKASVLWTTFVIFQLYLAIAFGSVTHRDLFLETPIKMPLLNVDLPLVGFFTIAPTVLLIFHFYVFLQLAGLASKAIDYNTLLVTDAPVASDRQYLRQRLDVFPILQFLAGPRDRRTGFSGFSLRLIAWITLVATPVLILLQGQVTFLPYHREWIVWLQRIAVLIDLAVVWYFWVRLRSDGEPIGWAPQKAKMFVAGAGTLCVLVFSVLLAAFPGEWMKTHLPELRLIPTTKNWISLQALLFEGDVDEVIGRPLSVFSNRLVLNNQSVVDPEKLDKITISRSFRGRDLRLAVLTFADLRKADFTGAQLQGAVLQWAKLQGASLNRAQLQGAWLNWAELQGASLEAAQLQGASLVGAELQGASLNSAELQGASLDSAQLQGAVLERARLQGASLNRAQLQGAWLMRPTVWRANGHPEIDLADVANFDPDTVPWTAGSTFTAWRDAVLETIRLPGHQETRGVGSGAHAEPIVRNRYMALSRLSALDPAADKEPKAVVQTQFWNDALSAPPQGEERKKQLAAFLADLACLRDAAPHVARGLIRHGRLRSLGLQAAAVADRLRKGKSDPSACLGVTGFTGDDWAELDRLVDRAAAADAKTK
jgi:uncharacterized protein YjbI with pentapeptide repeats